MLRWSPTLPSLLPPFSETIPLSQIYDTPTCVMCVSTKVCMFVRSLSLSLSLCFSVSVRVCVNPHVLACTYYPQVWVGVYVSAPPALQCSPHDPFAGKSSVHACCHQVYARIGVTQRASMPSPPQPQVTILGHHHSLLCAYLPNQMPLPPRCPDVWGPADVVNQAELVITT
jgi:hypothetical protein